MTVKVNKTVSKARIEIHQDSVAPLFTHAGHTSITFTYDDVNNKIIATVAPQFNGGVITGDLEVEKVTPKVILDNTGIATDKSCFEYQHNGVFAASMCWNENTQELQTTVGATSILNLTSSSLGIGGSPATDAVLSLRNSSNTPAVYFSRTGAGLHDGAIQFKDGSFDFKGATDSATVGGLSNLMTLSAQGDLYLAGKLTAGSFAEVSASFRLEASGSAYFYSGSDGITIDPNSGAAHKIYTNFFGGSEQDLILGTWSNKDTQLVLAKNSNVGINKAVPLATLDIAGSLSAYPIKFYNYAAPTINGQTGVSNGFVATLNGEHGLDLDTLYRYVFRLTTAGTGTRTGATYVIWYDSSGSQWAIRATSLSGSGSNHPALAIVAGQVVLYTNHATAYTINYSVETYRSGEDSTTLHHLGEFYGFQRLDSTLSYTDGDVYLQNNLSIGATNVLAPLTVKHLPATSSDYLAELRSDGNASAGLKLSYQGTQGLGLVNGSGGSSILASTEISIITGSNLDLNAPAGTPFIFDTLGNLDITSEYRIGGSSVLSRAGGTLKLGDHGTWTSLELHASGVKKVTLDTAGNLTMVSGNIKRDVTTAGYQIGSFVNGANDVDTNPIFALGSAYVPNATTLGNMYGTGYTNANAAGFLTAPKAAGLTGYGQYIASDGDARVFLDGTLGKIWTSAYGELESFIDGKVSGGVANYLPLTGGTLAGPGNLTIAGELNTNSSIFLNAANGSTFSTASRAIDFYVTHGSYRIGLDTQGATKGYIRHSINVASSVDHGHVFGRHDASSNLTDLFIMRADGRFGVGTMGPNADIQVHNASFPIIKLTNSSVVGPSNGGLDIVLLGTEAFFINRENASMRFRTNDIDRLFIKSDGKVGIGTTAPLKKLDILGDLNVSLGGTGVVFTLDGTTSNLTVDLGSRIAGYTTFRNSASDIGTNGFNFQSANNNILTIQNSGNVGVGTIAPTEKLDVNGNIKMGTSPTLSWISNSLSLVSATDAISVVQVKGTPSFNPRFEVWDANNVNQIVNLTAGTSWINGSLAVGTSSTSHRFEVRGSSVLFDNTLGDFTLKINSNTVADKTMIEFGDTTTPLARIGVGGTSGDIIADSTGQDFNVGTSGGNGSINFSVDNYLTTILKLDGATGRVGINTVSPTSDLTVNGSFNVTGTSSFNTIAASAYRSGNTNIANVSNTWWKIGSIQNVTQSDVISIRVLGTSAYSEGSPIAGTSIIELRVNNQASKWDGYYYGLTEGLGVFGCVVNASGDVFVKVNSYFSLNSIVDIVSNSGSWIKSILNVGASVPVGVVIPSKFHIHTNGVNSITVAENNRTGFGTFEPKLGIEVRNGDYSFPANTGTAAVGSVRAGQAGGACLDIGVGDNGTTASGWLQATNASALANTYSLALNPNGGGVSINKTNAPGANLDIQSSDNANSIFVRRTSGGIAHNLNVSSNGDANYIMYGTGQTTKINLNTNGDSYFAGGDFGLGLNNPGHQLHVDKNPVAGLAVAWIHNSNNVVGTYGTVISTVANAATTITLDVRSSNTTVSNGNTILRVRGDGNVGINQPAPVQKLDLVGNAIFSGSIGVGTGNLQRSLHVAGQAIIGVATSTNLLADLQVERSANTSFAIRSQSGSENVLQMTIDDINGRNTIWSRVGTGATSDIAFGFGSLTNIAMNIYASSGNVAIGGVPTSTRKLTVVATNVSDNVPVRIISGSTTSDCTIDFQDGNTTGDYYVRLGSKGDAFTLHTGGTEKVMVLATGEMGIGATPDVGQRLHVAGNLYASGALILRDNATYSAESNGQIMAFQGNDSAGTIREFSQIRGISAPSGVNNAGQVSIWTRKSGSMIERLRIDEEGRLGLGTTALTARMHIHTASLADTYTTYTNTVAANGFQVGVDAGGGARIWHKDPARILFATSNVSRIEIGATGNITSGLTPTLSDSVIFNSGIFMGANNSIVHTSVQVGDYHKPIGCTILGGENNTVQSFNNGSILYDVAKYSTVIGGRDCFAGGGFDNDSTLSIIGGTVIGSDASTSQGPGSVILGSDASYIDYKNAYCGVYASSQGRIDNSTLAMNFCVLQGTASSTIKHVSGGQPSYAGIYGSQACTITSSSYAIIQGSSANSSITDSIYSRIVNCYFGVINTSGGSFNSILSGTFNTISGSASRSMILAGGSLTVTGSQNIVASAGSTVYTISDSNVFTLLDGYKFGMGKVNPANPNGIDVTGTISTNGNSTASSFIASANVQGNAVIANTSMTLNGDTITQWPGRLRQRKFIDVRIQPTVGSWYKVDRATFSLDNGEVLIAAIHWASYFADGGTAEIMGFFSDNGTLSSVTLDTKAVDANRIRDAIWVSNAPASAEYAGTDTYNYQQVELFHLRTESNLNLVPTDGQTGKERYLYIRQSGSSTSFCHIEVTGSIIPRV